MFRKCAFPILFVLLIISLLLSACTPAAQTIVQTVLVEKPGAPGKAAAATALPTAPAAPVPATASASSRGLGPSAPNRMIIKNGEMTLLVADTDVALDRATAVAVETGGYIVSSKTWLQDGFRYAAITMGVPVDQFETAQRRLRTLAVQVTNDTASGQDVSDEYVDLQSRLANLEATQARIREFLQQAKDVDEALQVNAKLTEVEAEINQVKGRMNYLEGRSSFSTLTVNLEPQRPTPTPSPTPTPTPTPTPAVWRPDKTFQSASGTLVQIVQALVDLLIWVVVIIGPFAVPAIVVVWLVWKWARRKEAKRQPAVVKPVIPPISTDSSAR